MTIMTLVNYKGPPSLLHKGERRFGFVRERKRERVLLSRGWNCYTFPEKGK